MFGAWRASTIPINLMSPLLKPAKSPVWRRGFANTSAQKRPEFPKGGESQEDGYRAMAVDAERERDASEWISGLAGDTVRETR